MHRMWWLAVLLLLVACRPQAPVPVEVSFPDDPRILQGEWQLQVNSRLDMVSYQFDSTATKLLVSSGSDSSWYYELLDGQWVDREPVPAGLGTYDPTLDSWVRVTRTSTTLTAVVADWDGHEAQHNFTLPADVTVQETAVGSGRVIAIVKAESGLLFAHWWNLVDSTDHGHRAVPTHREGMQQSADGRFLSFWDLIVGRIHILDTAAPQREAEFQLGGFCRRSGPSDADPAGRWFVTLDCRDQIQVYDLHDPSAGARNLGVSGPIVMQFAADGSELLWLDPGHNIRGRDLNTGQNVDYHRISNSDGDSMRFYNVQLYRNQAAGVFATSDLTGHMTIIRADEPAVMLPQLPFRTAELQLTAALDGSDVPAASYSVAGVFLADGSSEPLAVSGTADGGSHHVYLPLAAPPPPPFGAFLEMTMPGTDQAETVRYELRVQSEHRDDVEFRGIMRDNPNRDTYLVRLVRPD